MALKDWIGNQPGERDVSDRRREIAFAQLRAKKPSELTPQERDFLHKTADYVLGASTLSGASSTETKPVSPELSRFAVFEGDVPRKAGKDMGDILRLNALFNERVSPEALRISGLSDKNLVGRSIESLYTGGLAIEPAKAAKLATIQWGLIGNNPQKLYAELPALTYLVSAKGTDPVRQRLRDSVDQSVKFYNRGISSNATSYYRKTLFNHVIEGNSPDEVSMARNSELTTTDVPVLKQVNPYLRTLAEASREAFTRPDEFLQNKPTPYSPPENKTQAVAETIVGSLPGWFLPEMSGTPSDLLQNAAFLPLGAVDAANTISKVMPNPLVSGLSKATKAAEPALASVSAATTADEFFKALASANKGKAVGKAVIEEAIAAGHIPEFLAPFVVKTPSGKTIIDLSPEAAAALKIDPAQAKLFNEVNYAEKVKGDWQSAEWARKKMAAEGAGPKLNPVESQKAAQEAEAAAITGEAALNRAKGTLEEVRSQQKGAQLQARKNADVAAQRTRAQELAKQQADEGMMRQAQAIEPLDDPFLPRPTFEKGPEVLKTQRTGQSTEMTTDEILGALQNGKAGEVTDEALMLASKGKKGLSKVPLEDGPVKTGPTTNYVAQEILGGRPLSKELQAYFAAHTDDVLSAVQQERAAGKVTGEVATPAPKPIEPAGAPPPAVQQAAKEAQQAQATAASTAQNVDEAAAAANIKQSLPIREVTEPEKTGTLGKTLTKLGVGGGLAGAGWVGYNALTAAKDKVNAERNSPVSDYQAFLNSLAKDPNQVQWAEQIDTRTRNPNVPVDYSQALAEEGRLQPEPSLPVQPIQAPPVAGEETAFFRIPSPETMRRAYAESVPVTATEKPSLGWKDIVGGLANATAVGAETYNTGVDPRRAWHELALQQQREAKIMPQMDAAAMQNYYAQRQAILNKQLDIAGYGGTAADLARLKAQLAQQLYNENLKNKSEAEQNAFMFKANALNAFGQ